ncbi:MAG TPA: NAD-glutamate dehydrogenase domain-containing protein [Vicinamibacteria bacterium]|nr:NAD-glutamate dehydrogenase domain-containing protein [Vicinamibacteria bacterium]
MITSDPHQRAAKLAQVREILTRQAAAEDRELLLSFASVVFAETPDRVALGLSPDALAARLMDQFRFVVREMPPPTQLYKGLPGLHVVARNPGEAGWGARGPANGLPQEITVVETHTPDAPFIFESLKNYFRKAGLRVYSSVHPMFTVRRQWERIVWIGGPHDEGAREVYCHFQIERIETKERLRHLEHEIHSVLKAVLTAVEDFPEMLGAAREPLPRLRSRRGRPEDAESARAFLEWLLDDNYIFQGTVRYRVGADGRPHRVGESASGVFTDATLLPVVFPGLIEEVEAHLLPAANDFRIIDIDYCNTASAIYHLEPIDDIVLREWGPDGDLEEATLLVGRLAKGAFTQKRADIPLLEEKLEWLLAQSGAQANSYAYREIRAVFNRFPTRELFYANVQALKEIIDRIVYMTGDDEIAVHTRKGPGYRALSIAFSRLRYSYRIEQDLAKALSNEFGPVSFSTSEDLGAVSLLLFYFDASRLEHALDPDAVRALTESLVTTWEDRAFSALEKGFGEREGRALFRRYVTPESRSGLYREVTPPEEVPEDVRRLDALEARLEVRVIPGTATSLTLKLFSVRPLALAATLRTLQNLGLVATDDMRIPIRLPDGRRAEVFRFEVEGPAARIASLVEGEGRLVDALRALDEDRATDDPLNGLVLDAGLTWREVEVLRTLRNHLLQVRTHYNVETVNGVLLRNRAVARALYRSFAARFDPALPGERAAAMTDASAEVARALEAVRSLAEDEVLRGMDNLIRAALRTNFYQRPERPVVSIKVESRKVEGMPSPRPLFEIYVHSRRLEGIHLRGGKVARGGIRWSDRHDDFRTEVLGLMKTQMVKNAIIVPVGSKGGFVLKGAVPPRPALDAYLVDRYREYIAGLLDVTDNVVDGQVLHPPEVVRHDGDDPYLVVAADKGTAHLSDTANSVSAQYGFWLGDAFASGGSHGWDHKKVAITARGAWECVKHHFKNLGHDVQTQAFTCAGIGDMAGDVFGNGMLQSRALKLVAAFNHAHIFIDPAPDPEKSFRERERLFLLPRSAWSDYDASLISKGGGIFERSAKAIPLGPEVKRLLDVEGDTASGEEVIRRILAARVDLLYNGGIGTYVKASFEDDAEVGDRANDRVRVDGGDVRARVVAEGGNLGFTQAGRIEYWARGGRVNTDAVDNSGGVDLSDHEVNIKILLDLLVKKGAIRNREERNAILAEMAEEVAELVLADNANQAHALTLDGQRSAARYEEFVDFVESLASAGVLSRTDNAIPTRQELLEAPERERGLPRPMLAVLLGHTKMWAFQTILETEFPDGASARPSLDAYFPRRLQAFAAHFEEHPLRREIIATVAVNSLVNEAGVTFLPRMMALTRRTMGEVVAAYLDLDRQVDARALRDRVERSGLASAAETALLLEIEDALETMTRDRLTGAREDAAAALEPIRAKLAGTPAAAKA